MLHGQTQVSCKLPGLKQSATDLNKEPQGGLVAAEVVAPLLFYQHTPAVVPKPGPGSKVDTIT